MHVARSSQARYHVNRSSASKALPSQQKLLSSQQVQLKSSCGSPLASASVPDLFARHAASDSVRVKGVQLAATLAGATATDPSQHQTVSHEQAKAAASATATDGMQVTAAITSDTAHQPHVFSTWWSHGQCLKPSMDHIDDVYSSSGTEIQKITPGNYSRPHPYVGFGWSICCHLCSWPLYHRIIVVVVPCAAVLIDLGNAGSELPVVPDGRQNELALCCTTVIF